MRASGQGVEGYRPSALYNENSDETGGGLSPSLVLRPRGGPTNRRGCKEERRIYKKAFRRYFFKFVQYLDKPRDFQYQFF